jgi:hypothetical protein
MSNKKSKVFLGGTCNDSTWRDVLIPLLKIDYFNPVVKDWTPECLAREIYEREVCDVCLYVITPRMTGVYSIAEAVDDSNKRPQKIILTLLREDGDYEYSEVLWKSLLATAHMVIKNGGKVFFDLESTAEAINKVDYCPECGHHWLDHDFGVPAPFCP